MRDLPNVAREERAAWALKKIIIMRGGVPSCEHVIGGVGDCHRSGRTPDAEYLADRWCHSCTAYFGLHGYFPEIITCEAT
jgi:hypothetical protein